MSVHMDRGYDSKATREKLEARGLTGVIAEKGKPAPLQAAKRCWIVERKNSWHGAHKKLSWIGASSKEHLCQNAGYTPSTISLSDRHSPPTEGIRGTAGFSHTSLQS